MADGISHSFLTFLECSMIELHSNAARSIVHDVILAFLLAFGATTGRLTDAVDHHFFEFQTKQRAGRVESTARIDFQHVFDEQWHRS